MKKIRYLAFYPASFLLIILAISVLPINAQSSDNTWIGIYEFFDAQTNGQRNQPGNFINYTLTVSKNGNSFSARFTADGTQTSDEFECRVESKDNSLKVFFGKDLNGMNESRFSPFKKEQLLFTLMKTQIAKKTKYLFRAGYYEILPLSTVFKNRIYFNKKLD